MRLVMMIDEKRDIFHCFLPRWREKRDDDEDWVS